MLEQMVNFLNDNCQGCQATAPEVEKGDRGVLVNSSHIKSVCETLRDSPEYDMTSLQVITGCDYPDRIEVSYFLASFKKNHEVMVKTKLPKASPKAVPEIQSVCSVWKAANFQERECFDMVGVKFLEHPDHRRILCPEDWQGYPLRKDYQVEKEYNGMVVNPEEKINSADHFFYKKLYDEVEDPKKLTFSWKDDSDG